MNAEKAMAKRLARQARAAAQPKVAEAPAPVTEVKPIFYPDWFVEMCLKSANVVAGWGGRKLEWAAKGQLMTFLSANPKYKGRFDKCAVIRDEFSAYSKALVKNRKDKKLTKEETDAFYKDKSDSYSHLSKDIGKAFCIHLDIYTPKPKDHSKDMKIDEKYLATLQGDDVIAAYKAQVQKNRKAKADLEKQQALEKKLDATVLAALADCKKGKVVELHLGGF